MFRVGNGNQSNVASFYEKYAGFRIVFGDERADMIVSNAYGVEEFLLLSAPTTVFQSALHAVAAQMNPEDNEAPVPNRDCDDWAGHPYIIGTDKVQSYEPKTWNDGGNVQMNDNCYNYGTNIITQTFAQVCDTTNSSFSLRFILHSSFQTRAGQACRDEYLGY
jgi:hypothetical protein